MTCADQDEVDYYWDGLLAGGGEPSVCGWLRDRYSVRWQVVPAVFYAMVRDEDQARKARVTAAMLSMVKFDIAAFEKAYAGGSPIGLSSARIGAERSRLLAWNSSAITATGPAR